MIEILIDEEHCEEVLDTLIPDEIAYTVEIFGDKWIRIVSDKGRVDIYPTETVSTKDQFKKIAMQQLGYLI